MAVIFENKSTNLNKISEALEDNLNIIPSDSRLKTIVDTIADSRYTFKKVGESGTLPITSERPSLLYNDWLYVGGGEALGNALVIIDTKTMQIIKQITLASGVNIVSTYNIVSDGTYWYIGTDTAHLIKGNLATGEVVLSQYNASYGSIYNICVDDDYVYICGSGNKVRKLSKTDLSIIKTSTWSYTTPITLICKDNYLYLGGTGSTETSQAILKVLKSDLSIINTSIATGGQVRDLLIRDDYIYSAASDGGVKKWLISDLSAISTVYQHTTIVRSLKQKLGDFWLVDNGGKTLRVSSTGELLATIETENSNNFVLEIDESSQILYRNASVDVTVAKFQIIDNLENNTSTTVLKTADLIALNTAGTWLDTVYTLNDMSMTCNTLSNGYLTQLSFTGTTTANTAFILAEPNVNNKLTPNKSYILNGVKSTDSLSTVFIRLTQYQNSDGSGLSKVTEKEAGDFKVFIAADDDYLYYKIAIVIKSGVTLTNSLYNNIPSMVPSSITYEQGEGPYLIKDLSTISANAIVYLNEVDGKIFTMPQFSNAGIVLVLDYQSDTLLTTISTEATQNTNTVAWDNTYVYIPKCVHNSNQKWVYLRRYNKRTLNFINEVLIYQYLGGVENSANISGIVENGDFLYVASLESTDAGNKHKIRKLNKSDFTTASYVEDLASYDLVKSTNGFYSLGGGNSTYPNRVIYYDWNLNIIQVFPQTTLTTNKFRCAAEKDGYLYACNDSGNIVKYAIATNTIVAQKSTGEITLFRNIFILKDVILVQQNLGVIRAFDLNLTFLKSWDYYNTTTQGGAFYVDKNNTIWSQNRSTANIYKKQFIDLSSGVM